MENQNDMITSAVLWGMKKTRTLTKGKASIIESLGGRFVDILGKFYTAFRNPETPVLHKVLIILCMLYMVSPIDFVPDKIPVVGWIDDVLIGGAASPFIAAKFSQFTLAHFDKWLAGEEDHFAGETLEFEEVQAFHGSEDEMESDKKAEPKTIISLAEHQAKKYDPSLDDTKMAELRRYKALFDEGILTEDEYSERKKQILAS